MNQWTVGLKLDFQLSLFVAQGGRNSTNIKYKMILFYLIQVFVSLFHLNHNSMFFRDSAGILFIFNSSYSYYFAPLWVPFYVILLNRREGNYVVSHQLILVMWPSPRVSKHIQKSSILCVKSLRCTSTEQIKTPT